MPSIRVVMTHSLAKRGRGRLLLAQSRHAQCADECRLLGAKRTVTNRCLPISIYEYTTGPAHVPSRVNQAARLHIGIEERRRPSFRPGPRMLFGPQGSVVVIIARQSATRIGRTGRT